MATQPDVLRMYKYLVMEAKKCNALQFWKMYLVQGICEHSMLRRLEASTLDGDDDDDNDNGGGDDGNYDGDDDDDDSDDDDDDDVATTTRCCQA